MQKKLKDEALEQITGGTSFFWGSINWTEFKNILTPVLEPYKLDETLGRSVLVVLRILESEAASGSVSTDAVAETCNILKNSPKIGGSNTQVYDCLNAIGSYASRL